MSSENYHCILASYRQNFVPEIAVTLWNINKISGTRPGTVIIDAQYYKEYFIYIWRAETIIWPLRSSVVFEYKRHWSPVMVE